MNRYCLALDLVDDPQLIAEYEEWHSAEKGWPEIKKSITDGGITNMEIYRFGNRLFMIMDTDETFSFGKKAEMDAANPKVQEWEKTDVEIPAIHTRFKTGRKMGDHEKNISTVTQTYPWY